MKNELTHPDPDPSSLPLMSIKERQIWAASHRLPRNMLIVAVSEMEAVNRRLLIDGLALRQLQGFCKAAYGTDDPSQVVERYNRTCEQFNILEEFFLSLGDVERFPPDLGEFSIRTAGWQAIQLEKLKAAGWTPPAAQSYTLPVPELTEEQKKQPSPVPVLPWKDYGKPREG